MTQVYYPTYKEGIGTSSLSSSDDLPEGTVNLYYTDGKVQNFLNASTFSIFSNIDESGKEVDSILKWDGSNWVMGAPVPRSSDAISESGNLFYTDSRVQTFIEANSLDLFSNVVLTSPEADQVLSYSGGNWINQDLSVLLDGLTTDDLTEGSNLYYTEQRVLDVITAQPLSALSNVTNTTASPNDLLQSDGTNWIPTSLDSIIVDELANLVDVDTSGATEKQLLQLVSGTWVARTPELGDIIAGSEGQYLQYSGGSWVAVTANTSNQEDLSEENIDFSAEVNRCYLVDTGSGIVTATLPTGAGNGDVITFVDLNGSDPSSPSGFGLNKLVVSAGAGDNIQGYSSLDLDKENQAIKVVYSVARARWSIISFT